MMRVGHATPDNAGDDVSMTAITQQAATLWRLDGSRAFLDCDAIHASVDVAQARGGLAELRFRGAPIEGWLLGVDVEAPAPPTDAYVRGGDLVVAYQESADRPFSVQIYWSIRQKSPLAGALVLDGAVSIQTRQWEAYPRVTVSSHIAGAERIALDATATVMRPAGVEWSYVEVVPAEDFVQVSPSDEGPTAISGWIYDGHFMERGVIRRLRVRGAFVPRVDDLEAAVRLRAHWLAEQPPLTA
jgi:hypothetical protein